MDHPLHKEIGKFVRQLALPGSCLVISAQECGGAQNIPLFYSSTKSNSTEFCNVDLAILRGGKIRLIMEIEESNLLPTQICGKFMTSALSTYLIHKTLNDQPVGKDNAVKFIQILDSTKLAEGATKVQQGHELEKAIRSVLPLGKISTYHLFYFHGVDDFHCNQAKRKDLQDCIDLAVG